MEGKLPIKPERSSISSCYEKVEKAETDLGLSKMQISGFENFLFEYALNSEKQGFAVGFRVAFRLLSEIFEIPADKSTQT